MQIPYFPGCTLSTTATGLDKAAREASAILGVELKELRTWNCCGATFPLLVDNLLDLAGPARVLVSAREEGDRVVTACTTCYNVLRRTNLAIRSDEEKREKLNLFIESDYQGDVEVLDLMQVLRDEVGMEAIRQAVVRPLGGMRVAAYYGCMVLRPPAEVAYEPDPDNPRALDDLLLALGAEPVEYPHKAECCGAYLAVKSLEVTARMVYTIVEAAVRAGAEALLTNCPLCQFNLDKQQQRLRLLEAGFRPIPVFYFAQLLAAALGRPIEAYDLHKHKVDPRPLLERYQLLGVKV
ncbi:MAG: CoB--CoM heterodisulfide reductase iron-sulfur subunit B family protein [Anaerolineae bacterium]|nr:CoB--CoM heterodisulfide reductase iron-sulfur subunit B family protein [Anaerolineae bacterium]